MKKPIPIPIDKPVKNISAPRDVWWGIFVPGIGINYRQRFKSEEKAQEAIDRGDIK